jgi:hypothetical protein
MDRRYYVAVLTAVAIGCTATPPPKAPGSNPSDMTAAEHHNAAERDRTKSEQHRIQAAEALRSHQRQQQAAEHREAAERYENFAEQHERAGELATDVR